MPDQLGRPACECEVGDDTRDSLHRSKCPVFTAYKARCTCPGLITDRMPHEHKPSCPDFDASTAPDRHRCSCWGLPGRKCFVHPDRDPRDPPPHILYATEYDFDKKVGNPRVPKGCTCHTESWDIDKHQWNCILVCSQTTIADQPTPEVTPVSTERTDAGQILADAEAIISRTGERGQTYGEASTNFERIANLWEPILGVRGITAEQVALCMNQVKVSRLIESPTHRDSWLDGAAYMALGGGIAMIPGRYV